MTSNITLVAGLLAIALFVSAIGTFTAVTKLSITGLQTGTANANVSATADITVTPASINFGSISIGVTLDTTGAVPPFVVQNDGSVNISVAINSTALWTTQNTSTYYRVRCRDSAVAPFVPCGPSSLEDYTNMPVNAPIGAVVIANLPFLNNADNNYVDIQITVPVKEPVGVDSATVTFIATQT